MPPFLLKRCARWAALPLAVMLAAISLSAADVSAPVTVLLQGTSGSPASAVVLYPYLPPATNNTGAGVLIVPSRPGVGQAPDLEAFPTAQWLNAHGLAAFVLHYTLNNDSGSYAVIRAMQNLHAHAADYHLSVTRIGVLGFGPGGALAISATFEGTALSGPITWRPDFLALIYGAAEPPAYDADDSLPRALIPPPTFLVGSTSGADKLSSMIDLWNALRRPPLRVPVEAHFFPKVDIHAGLAQGDPSVGAWPDLFYHWVRAYGFLTDQPRVAIHGSVLLDGRPLPHGYVIFTPLDGVGAGPIVAHVFNSTQGVPIGSFSVPANQGPVPGHYRVDVRQNDNRWLSNTFSGDLIRDPAFGHSRILSPSIDDQHSFTKAHPGDQDDLTVEIKPDGNTDLNIAVFSQ
jgi:hypothetical protein